MFSFPYKNIILPLTALLATSASWKEHKRKHLLTRKLTASFILIDSSSHLSFLFTEIFNIIKLWKNIFTCFHSFTSPSTNSIQVPSLGHIFMIFRSQKDTELLPNCKWISWVLRWSTSQSLRSWQGQAPAFNAICAESALKLEHRRVFHLKIINIQTVGTSRVIAFASKFQWSSSEQLNAFLQFAVITTRNTDKLSFVAPNDTKMWNWAKRAADRAANLKRIIRCVSSWSEESSTGRLRSCWAWRWD